MYASFEVNGVQSDLLRSIAAARSEGKNFSCANHLEFYPQSPDTEGRYHQLRVTVRRGRHTVRARPGYGHSRDSTPRLSSNDVPYASKTERKNGRLFYRDDFSDKTSGRPNRQTAKYTSKGYQLAGENVVAINGPFFSDFRAAVSVDLARGSVAD
jgi:hypothetical protein